MSEEQQKEISLDVLKHVEALSEQVNSMMASRTKSVLRRYPLTFALLTLAGIIAVSEGVKDIIEEVGFLSGHPWRLLILGLFILVVTGTLYKKLDH